MFAVIRCPVNVIQVPRIRDCFAELASELIGRGTRENSIRTGRTVAAVTVSAILPSSGHKVAISSAEDRPMCVSDIRRKLVRF